LSTPAVPEASKYHQRQAETLTRLAQTTRDSETASALMRLAAEHTALAEKAADENRRSHRQSS